MSAGIHVSTLGRGGRVVVGPAGRIRDEPMIRVVSVSAIAGPMRRSSAGSFESEPPFDPSPFECGELSSFSLESGWLVRPDSAVW